MDVMLGCEWDDILGSWPRESSFARQQAVLRQASRTGIPSARRPFVYRMVLLHHSQQSVSSADVKRVLNLAWPSLRPYPLIGSKDIFVDELLRAYGVVEGDSVRYSPGIRKIAWVLWDLLNPYSDLDPNGSDNTKFSPLKARKQLQQHGDGSPTRYHAAHSMQFSDVVECFHSLLHNPYHRVKELYCSGSGSHLLGSLCFQLFHFMSCFTPALLCRIRMNAFSCETGPAPVCSQGGERPGAEYPWIPNPY